MQGAKGSLSPICQHTCHPYLSVCLSDENWGWQPMKIPVSSLILSAAPTAGTCTTGMPSWWSLLGLLPWCPILKVKSLQLIWRLVLIFKWVAETWMHDKVPTHFPQQWLPGGRLNIKTPSYQYGDPHVKDKTVSWLWIKKQSLPLIWRLVPHILYYSGTEAGIFSWPSYL